MPVNWKDPEAFTRLLAAIVAANDMKLDYRKIATMYGNGATYDSIEGRFRIIRKEAAKLKSEIDSGERPPAPPRNANTTNDSATPVTTPKKPKPNTTTPKKEKTLGGRVAKSANATPTKKGAHVTKIKEEPDSSNSSFLAMEDREGGTGGFFDANLQFDTMMDDDDGI